MAAKSEQYALSTLLLVQMHNFLSFNRIIDNWPNNTAAHQRARLLEAMKIRAGVTTLEAMRFLDIVDPRARIAELRKAGYYIETSWVRQPSECGRLHAVGLYTLEGKKEHVVITKPSRASHVNSARQMGLALW